MISQNPVLIQHETLKNILQNIPAVIVNDKNEVFILIKNLDKRLEKFISEGILGTDENEGDDLSNDINVLNTLPEEHEQELITQWRLAGLEYRYRSQPFEFRGKKKSIRYIQVRNPQTGVTVSLIPWFLVPGKPYPIFLYLYAIWHYENSNPKSMELSATVTGRVFGVESFHKSTLSRNKISMEGFLEEINLDRPLSVEEPPIQSFAETISQITELMKECPSIKSLINSLGINAVQFPHPTDHGSEVSQALSEIPGELSQVTKEIEPARKDHRDTRKRTPRQCNRKKPREKPKPAYVESQEITRIRNAFIASCRAIVLDAAITFHRFVI